MMKTAALACILYSLMLFSVFAAGCGTQASDQELNPAIDQQKQQPADNLLSGSCTKELHCDTPTCSSYIDLDEDGLCDRGE